MKVFLILICHPILYVVYPVSNPGHLFFIILKIYEIYKEFIYNYDLVIPLLCLLDCIH